MDIGLFLLFGYNEYALWIYELHIWSVARMKLAAMNIHVQVFVWTRVSILSGGR